MKKTNNADNDLVSRNNTIKELFTNKAGNLN